MVTVTLASSISSGSYTLMIVEGMGSVGVSRIGRLVRRLWQCMVPWPACRYAG